MRRVLAMLAISLAFLVSVSLAQPAFAAAGLLDPTFGTGGKVLSPRPGHRRTRPAQP
jgi:hypothetical protein